MSHRSLGTTTFAEAGYVSAGSDTAIFYFLSNSGFMNFPVFLALLGTEYRLVFFLPFLYFHSMLSDTDSIKVGIAH